MTGTEFLERERDLHLRAEENGEELVWLSELTQRTVVVGRSGNVEAEVIVASCESDGVPVLRRDSGGGAVVLGAGCLNYSLILNLERRPALRDIEGSYRRIGAGIAAAIGIPGVAHVGGDLMFGGRKFGGSSQRRLRRTMLHHGTILYEFELAAVSRYLREPSRRPPHRQQRTHSEFLRNVSLGAQFQTRLREQFSEARFVS